MKRFILPLLLVCAVARAQCPDLNVDGKCDGLDVQTLVSAVLGLPRLNSQSSLSLVGSTQTQAVVEVRGSGPCVISIDPPIPDLDPAQYAGADTCFGRSDIIARADGSKILFIGHNIGNRALVAGASYKLTVDGATLAFTAAPVPVGQTQSFPMPVDRAVFGNRGNQMSIADLLAKRPMPDSLTGVVSTPGSGFTDWAWTFPNRGPGASAFAHWAGGDGWQNPASVLAGDGSTASTNNGNPLDLYVGVTGQDFDRAWYYTTLTDFAVKTFGSGAHLGVCMFVNPLDGCQQSGFQVDMTASSGMVQVASTSSDPDHPYPNQFPKPLFDGWGKDVVIRSPDRLTWGTLSAVAGVVTLDGVSDTSNISPTVKRGAKMYVAGSSCANNLCTVDRVISANKVALVEQINAPAGTGFEMMGFGIRIWNADPGKTLNIGVEWKAAGTRNVGVSSAGNAKCASGPGFMSGDNPPVELWSCSVPQNGVDLFYLLGKGTARVLHSIADMPPLSYFTDVLGWPAAEAPSDRVGGWCCGQMSYFPRDARSWYVYAANRAGGSSLWLAAYTGDGTENRDWNYQLLIGGDAFPQFGVEGTSFDKQKWSIVVGAKNDLMAQIAAKYPGYDAAFYGTAFQFAGVSNNTAYYMNQFSGMPQDGPAYIAMVDITTGKLGARVSTIEGIPGSLNLWGGWGGAHNLSPRMELPDTAALSLHSMTMANPAIKLGGPFSAKLDAVQRGGAWSTNTCLSFPVGDESGCAGVPPPDTDCSVLAPNNQYAFAGAVGNSCIAVRLPQLCNLFPHPAELAHPGWACPWNASYSHPFDLKVGDVLMENSSSGVWGETFRVLSIDAVTRRTVLQRNATSDYECVAPGPIPGSICVMGASQNWHPDQWSALAVAGGINGWQNAAYFLTGGVNPIVQAVAGAAGAGHVGYTQVSPGKYVTASSGGATVPADLGSMFGVPVKQYLYSLPQFHGHTLPVGNNSLQSYFVPVPDTPTGLDFNTLNNNGGWGHPPIGGGRDMIPTATPDIYQIEMIGDTSDLKSFFVQGSAGYWLLEDVSSPERPAAGPASGLMRDNTDCTPLHDGDCYTGSVAAAVGSHGRRMGYVHVSAGYDPQGTCFADVPYAKIPCLMVGWPGAGAVREQGITKDDPNGSNTRILSYLQDVPGQQRAYETAEPFSANSIWGPPTRVQGLINIQWILDRPAWTGNAPIANDFISVPFTVAAGQKFAKVVYGYRLFGDASNLRCSPRAEACNTTGTPYNFESETPVNLPDCTAGCTINVAAMAPTVLLAKVMRSSDGVTWVQEGDVQVIPLSGIN